MAAVTRRSYAGAAPACTLTNSITSADTTALLTGTVSAWNNTATGPFYMVIDPGLATEEKVLVGSRTGSSLSSMTRGVDGTTAASHTAGATCYPVFTATDANEANEFTSTMTTRGDLLTLNSSANPARIAIGASGRVLKSDGTDATWAISPETDLITTKGDLLVGTAADTLARQGVGSNGQVLVADSGQTNGIAWVDPQTNRNVVINGAMQVAQRGTSTASITTSGYYTADRFSVGISSMGTWTQSVENDAPTGSGFRKSLKMLCTTADASPAAGDLVFARTTLEGQNLQQFLKGTASAKQFAISFWVKSNVTGTYIADLEDGNNSRQVSASYTISASNTWEKKTVIFPADTTGAFTNDNGASLYITWWLGAGTTYTSGTLATTWASTTNANRAVGQTNLASAINNAWQITGVQLEAGAVATPFEFEDFGETFRKCRRYYHREQSGIANYAPYGLAVMGSNTIGEANVTHKGMRIAPTSLEFSTVAIIRPAVSPYAVTALVINHSSIDQSNLGYTTGANGGAQGDGALFVNNNSASSYLAFNAEL